MAKDTPNKTERTAPEKARRKPTTIDLPAEEVGRRRSDAKPVEDPAPASGATASAAADSSTAQAAVSMANEGLAGGAGPAGAETASASGSPESGAAKEPPLREKPAERTLEPAASFVPLLVAAILGGVVVAMVVVLLARGGYFVTAEPEGPDLASEIDALKSEVAALRDAGAEGGLAPVLADIAALKDTVGQLAAREPAAAPDPALLADIEKRLTALADSVAAVRSAAPGEASAATGDIAALRQELEALSARIGNAADADRVAALEAKLGAFETALDATGKTLDATNRKIDRAAALAPSVAADALAAALEAGRPFEAELAALRSLGVDAATLDGLAPHAAAGLPTLSSLRASFEESMAAVDLSTPVPQGAGVVDRLLQSARGLVAVRPANPTAGGDPSAIVTRIRGALDAGDLKTALEEWEMLPPAVKEATAGWARDAAARRDAGELVAKLRADALAALKAGP